MRKHSGILLTGILLLALFIAISAYTFHRSRDLIEEGYLASEGNAAQNFAVLAAENIHLTDAQVKRLKEASYGELMNSDENNELKSMMSSPSFMNKVDYAYIMVHLKNDEIKYSVTEENKDGYDAPVGTKLDIMWLLDVNVSEERTVSAQGADVGEYSRYSYYIEEDATIFGEAPTYIFNSSEWGEHICGYAPIYTTEGSYIGVIGIELQTGDYTEYCGRAVLAMGVLLLISLAMLSLLFVYIYTQYRKRQYERIYIDSLTQVYNRSYYNNRFIKVMNRRRRGASFALMITDVDWFKKVNDTFGHEVGDEVLHELGAVLSETFGMNYTARFGGEEFVAGLWFDDNEALRGKIEEFFEKIRTRKFSSREITLTVSLGCSYVKTESLNGWILSGLMRAADCKLYEAKGNGRDRYYIDSFSDGKVYTKAPSTPDIKEAKK